MEQTEGMSRSGREPKPVWQDIPRDVRAGVEAALGSGVRRGLRAWGGYGPTPTFRLLLADGRRAFFKAAGPRESEFVRAAFAREERVYCELGGLIAPWAPALYGSLQIGDWQILLLEDLGPKSAPPWTRTTARSVFHAYADFHRSTLGVPLPDWVRPPDRYLAREAALWDEIASKGDLERVAGLAGEQAGEALCWLEAALPALAAASRTLIQAPRPSFLHGDTRSDNLRWRGGRLYLFDWPHVGSGAAEFDLAAFAQTVTLEGGPEPEQLVAWYGERALLRPAVLDAAVSAVAAFFADAAWRDDLPGLPRLRPFQRAQLCVTLAWAARRLVLPEPAWLASLQP